jgi:hypothetical protein
MYPHKAIYGRQKQKFRTISFRFAPLHRMCDATTLLHAQPTHSPELPRSVGRDVNDVTSGGRYGWMWLTFWTFIIQRWLPHEFILNNSYLLKEENTPIAMNTNSFPEIVNLGRSQLTFRRHGFGVQLVLGESGSSGTSSITRTAYTPLAVQLVSCARKTLRVSTTATDSANSGCFVERGRCDRRSTQHAKIPSGSSLTSDTYE